MIIALVALIIIIFIFIIYFCYDKIRDKNFRANNTFGNLTQEELDKLTEAKEKKDNELQAISYEIAKIKGQKDEIEKQIQKYNIILLNAKQTTEQEVQDVKQWGLERRQNFEKECQSILEQKQKELTEQEELIKLAIENIQSELAQWRSIDNAARKERNEREIARTRNMILIDKIEEIEELLSVCHKLSNPIPLYKAIFDIYYKASITNFFTRINLKDKICGIYKITNQNDQKIYIGKSTDIKRRWLEHLKRGTGCETGTQVGENLYNAMLKEGIWNFSFEVLEVVDKEHYSDREKFWIDYFDSIHYGYNMKKG